MRSLLRLALLALAPVLASLCIATSAPAGSPATGGIMPPVELPHAGTVTAG